jgi:hypothetical protein
MTEYKDFLDWQMHPVTQFFVGQLENMREEMKEGLASGTYTRDSCEATALMHADIIGRCTVLDQIRKLDPSDYDLKEPSTEEEEN